jgi:hypothetical protein
MEVTGTLMDASDAADALWGVDGHGAVIVTDGPSIIEPVCAIVDVNGRVPVMVCGPSERAAVELLAEVLRRMVNEMRGTVNMHAHAHGKRLVARTRAALVGRLPR